MVYEVGFDMVSFILLTSISLLEVDSVDGEEYLLVGVDEYKKDLLTNKPRMNTPMTQRRRTRQRMFRPSKQAYLCRILPLQRLLYLFPQLLAAQTLMAIQVEGGDSLEEGDEDSPQVDLVSVEEEEFLDVERT